jgi:hypothetical protein
VFLDRQSIIVIGVLLAPENDNKTKKQKQRTGESPTPLMQMVARTGRQMQDLSREDISHKNSGCALVEMIFLKRKAGLYARQIDRLVNN